VIDWKLILAEGRIDTSRQVKTMLYPKRIELICPQSLT
jgi:hypothetical protein